MNAHNDYADPWNGRRAIKPIHPELEEPLADILAETYGLIVYQEQIMFIAQKVASYTMGKADALRKAMGKKEAGRCSKPRGLLWGMTANGFSERAVKAVCGTPSFRSPATRIQQVARGRLRPGVYWTAYPQGELSSE